MRERELSAAELAEIGDWLRQGLAWLELEPEATDPVVRVEAIAEGVEKLRLTGGGPLEALGAVWGDCLIRETDWSWVHLSGKRIVGPALVPPDRCVACFPMAFIERLVREKDADNSAVLTFNMIRDGALPPCLPGKYSVIA